MQEWNEVQECVEDQVSGYRQRSCEEMMKELSTVKTVALNVERGQKCKAFQVNSAKIILLPTPRPPLFCGGSSLWFSVLFLFFRFAVFCDVLHLYLISISLSVYILSWLSLDPSWFVLFLSLFSHSQSWMSLILVVVSPVCLLLSSLVFSLD